MNHFKQVQCISKYFINFIIALYKYETFDLILLLKGCLLTNVSDSGKFLHIANDKYHQRHLKRGERILKAYEENLMEFWR